MNVRINKGIICVITTFLILAGSFLMGTPASDVVASETTPISEKVLSVKCQLSNDQTKLRMVTTIDGNLQYKNVGFEVTFLGDDDAPGKTKQNTAKYVYRRINSTDNAIKYEVGPKAFDASSEWFATYTITIDGVEKGTNVVLIVILVIIIIIILIYLVLRLLGYKIYFNMEAVKAAFRGMGEKAKNTFDK